MAAFADTTIRLTKVFGYTKISEHSRLLWHRPPGPGPTVPVAIFGVSPKAITRIPMTLS